MQTFPAFKGQYTFFRGALILDVLVFAAMIGLTVGGIMPLQQASAILPISGSILRNPFHRSQRWPDTISFS
jgi:hypothetical protein